jgi:MFS family permease
MAGLGSVVGLLVGGTLTEYASWRWVLFINAPIAVAALIGTGLRVLVPGEAGRRCCPREWCAIATGAARTR